MNIDEFNHHHLDELDSKLVRSKLLASWPVLWEVRPDDLILYAAGHLAAAAPAQDADEFRKETNANSLEAESLFWRGVFEANGSLIWKRDASRAKQGAPSPRYPYWSMKGNQHLLLAFWAWLSMWSLYPHVSIKVREQIDAGRERLTLFGTDALFVTRCLYSRHSFGVYASIAAEVLEWSPSRLADKHMVDECSTFSIRPRVLGKIILADNK